MADGKRDPPDWAYPRMGGGTLKVEWWAKVHDGLSPHGRGNPWPGRTQGQAVGPIPAWAGEPW